MDPQNNYRGFWQECDERTRHWFLLTSVCFRTPLFLKRLSVTPTEKTGTGKCCNFPTKFLVIKLCSDSSKHKKTCCVLAKNSTVQQNVDRYSDSLTT